MGGLRLKDLFQLHPCQRDNVVCRGGGLKQADAKFQRQFMLAVQSNGPLKCTLLSGCELTANAFNQSLHDDFDRFAMAGRVIQQLLSMKLRWRMPGDDRFGHRAGHLVHSPMNFVAKTSFQVPSGQTNQLLNPIDAKLMKRFYDPVAQAE